MESGLWQADLSSAGSGPADICWKAFSIPSLNNNYGREVYNLNIKILQRIALLLASLPAIHPRPLVSTDAPTLKDVLLAGMLRPEGLVPSPLHVIGFLEDHVVFSTLASSYKMK